MPLEKCQKCGGVMLQMKARKTVLPDSEKKQGWKCSRCGYYLEKQQIFSNGAYSAPSSDDEPYYLRRRQS